MNHDFDFLYGTWRVTHRCRRERLRGCETWDDFAGSAVCRPLLGGVANVDEFFHSDGTPIGSTLRLYDLQEKRWTLHWASPRTGRLEPPLAGTFVEGVGSFYGHDVHDERPIQVRFIWDRIAPTAARWQQAFANEGGDRWETNWVMEFDRL